MRNKLTFALSIVALLAGMAYAGPTTIADTPANISFQSMDRELVELFCQPVDENAFAVATQHEDVYPFDAWVADDFYSDAGLAIDHMVFWGGFWNYTVFGQTDYLLVWIWAETGNCVPGYPGDGSELYLETITDFTATQMTNPDYFMYEFDMPAFTPVPGEVYWMAIQPHLLFDERDIARLAMRGPDYSTAIR